MPTKIQWCDEVWNPTTGCTRVSEGCRNCYAERFANRFRDMPEAHKLSGLTDKKGRWNGRIKFHYDRLDQPIRWKRPRMIFVDSMSDLFHPDVPFAFVDRVMATIAATERHTYQLLTKRPERMAEYFRDRWTPSPNLWVGTSVENHATACERVPHLLNCQAQTRFLSCEPLLGGLDLRVGVYESFGSLNGTTLEGIHWVIAGGESGPAARPMHPEWAKLLRDQCQEAGVAFFFKQWGEWMPMSMGVAASITAEELVKKSITIMPDGSRWTTKNLRQSTDEGAVTMHRVGKRKSGALLDGVEWKEFPKTGAPA